MNILLFFRRESRFSRILKNFFYNFHFLSSDRFDFTFTSPKKSEKIVFLVLESPFIFLLLNLEKKSEKTLSVTQPLPVFSINMWGCGRENQLYISTHHVFGYFMDEKSHKNPVFWDWLKNLTSRSQVTFFSISLLFQKVKSKCVHCALLKKKAKAKTFHFFLLG